MQNSQAGAFGSALHQSSARCFCLVLCLKSDQSLTLSGVEARELRNSEATSLSILGSAESDKKGHLMTDFRKMCQRQFLIMEVGCHCSQACRQLSVIIPVSHWWQRQLRGALRRQ